MIVLTQQDGPEISVNPLMIRTIRESSKKGSIISFEDGHCEYVKESPEVIRQMLDTWRDVQVSAVLTAVFHEAQKLEALKS